jgi:hypothetical protein
MTLDLPISCLANRWRPNVPLLGQTCDQRGSASGRPAYGLVFEMQSTKFYWPDNNR